MKHDKDRLSNEFNHSSEMQITLAKKEWIHPSLVTPKSSNYMVDLDEACSKFVALQRRNSIQQRNKLNII